MPLSSEVKKVTESKPFYAAAGAGDFAVTKLREVPSQLSRLQDAEARKELSDRAGSYAEVLGSRAVEFYEELAVRGKDALGRVNRQREEATKEITEQAKSTARSAQQTADSARKTADTTRKAATRSAEKSAPKETEGQASATAKSGSKSAAKSGAKDSSNESGK